MDHLDDRLSLYECIRDKVSDYFMKASYTASPDLINIFCTILGDKMLWNLLIKGLFHHLHYIPKSQLNDINETLSNKINILQNNKIKERELMQREFILQAMAANASQILKSDDSNTDDDKYSSYSTSSADNTKHTTIDIELKDEEEEEEIKESETLITEIILDSDTISKPISETFIKPTKKKSKRMSNTYTVHTQHTVHNRS